MVKEPSVAWSAAEGTPRPLGVTWVEEERAYNFALYSRHAESVTLLLYGERDIATPLLSYRLDHLRNKSGRVWHCRVSRAAVAGARFYAYAISGPPPAGALEWHRFDPDKILLDPYATSIFFPASFDRAAASRPGSNAGKAPLAFLCACESRFDWTGDRRPRHESDTVIYELHVRGFTQDPNSAVSAERRGTFLGVVEKIPRGGLMQTYLWQKANHGSLTLSTPLLFAPRAVEGVGPFEGFGLGANQIGAEAGYMFNSLKDGRLRSTMLTAAVLNGVDLDGERAIRNTTAGADVYLQALQLLGDRNTLGAFYYRGRTFF